MRGTTTLGPAKAARITAGAEAVGLRFLDHVVVTGGEWRRVPIQRDARSVLDLSRKCGPEYGRAQGCRQAVAVTLDFVQPSKDIEFIRNAPLL